MKRSEKIRLIKGLLRGTIALKELAESETEVWIQVFETETYKHFKTGEIITKSNLKIREGLNRRIIRMDFASGKTIL